MAPIIIDDDIKLKALLTHITKSVQKESDQLIFIDLEGVNLGRSGQIAIMQILMPPAPTVYLVDVHVLGARAFDLTNGSADNLRSILESKDIIKVFFDIRNDSDALHAHFGINIDGVIDLQLVEYASRIPMGKFVNGLARCIERDLPYQPGWSLTKANGRRLFAPEMGGRYEVFLERPMPATIMRYCEQDVMLMPQLLSYYGKRIRPGMAAQLPKLTEDRISLSKTPTYDGKGRHKAVGPQMAPYRPYADSSNNRHVNIICSERLSQLCRLHDVDVDVLTYQVDAMLVKDEQSEPSDEQAVSKMNIPAIVKDTMKRPKTVAEAWEACYARQYLEQRRDEDEDQQDVYYRSIGYPVYNHGDDIDDIEYEPDYSACSAEDCGYCGNCGY